MIEVTRVQPKPANGMLPRGVDCEVHHEAARAFADGVFDHAEVGHLARVLDAKVQFEQTDPLGSIA